MDDEIKDGSSAHGWSNMGSQTIVVCECQKADAVQDTFLHEVIHAVYYVMGLDDSSKEEKVVQCLATGLCTVWRSNRKAFEWWQSLA